MSAAVRRDTDWQLVGEIPEGLARWCAKPQVWQLVGPESCGVLEVLDLLFLGAEPSKLSRAQNAIEQHQPLDRTAQRRRPSIAVVGFVDRRVETLSLNVVKPTALMC